MDKNKKIGGVILPPPPCKNSNKIQKVFDRIVVGLKSCLYQKILQDKEHCNSHYNPWVFIRVKNEIQTLRARLWIDSFFDVQ